MKSLVYLDNSATTRISEEALATYIEVSREHFGNPSSLHALGADAEKILDDVRSTLRRAIGAKDGEVVFSAGGSEANNLAIFGRAYAKERYRRGGKILTTAGEHASVGAPLEKLSGEGFRVVTVKTTGGVLDIDDLKREMTPDVILVSMMMVNNETGALYDVGAVSAIMKKQSPEAVLHVDATQSFLKVPFSVSKLGIDLLTVSSHKIHGPKGVGALWISRDVIGKRGLAPLILGGGQEGGFRSGTENVPGVAAFGTAIKLGFDNLSLHIEKMKALRDYLIGKITTDGRFSEISLSLPPVAAPHILNLTLPGIKSETMLHHLSSFGICVSSGSACSSHGHKGSPALVAFGRSEAEADSSLRVSFSEDNTTSDCDALCDALADGLARLVRTGKPRPGRPGADGKGEAQR